MRNPTFAFLSIVAAAGAIIVLSCKSHSDDCAPFPTQSTYDCEPLEAGEVTDGGVCGPLGSNSDASPLTYPIGCSGHNGTMAVAANAVDDPCPSPIQCFCSTAIGGDSGPLWLCPD